MILGCQPPKSKRNMRVADVQSEWSRATQPRLRQNDAAARERI